MTMRLSRGLPLAAALMCLVSAVQAGSVSSAASVRSLVLIEDDGGHQWTLDLAPLVSVDQATGNVSLNTAPISTVLASGSDAGAWTTVTGTNGATALQWHSWTRVDGTLGTDTAGGANPWLSVLTVQGIGGNLDPVMSYDLQFRNNGTGTQTFTYTQGEVMDGAISGAYQLHAELNGSLTNASASTTTLALAPVGGGVQSIWLGNGGVASVDAGVSLGGAASLPMGSALGSYGTFAGNANGVGSYDYWEFRTRFTLSGGKDVATLSGYAEILAVPDSGGLALALSGLLALAGAARRSSRKD